MRKHMANSIESIEYEMQKNGITLGYQETNLSSLLRSFENSESLTEN